MNDTVTVAIMQPYFLPYIGYWQLLHHADTFVIYDDIEYSKKGWVNRNCFLLNGQAATFTLPIAKDSDFLDIRERKLANTFETEKEKIIRRLESAYRSAPFFSEGKLLLNDIFSSSERNLFLFIYQSVKHIHTHLDMKSRLVISSSLEIPRELKGQNRVIATLKALRATHYVNPIGGVDLYDKDTFMAEGVRLQFQKVRPYHYTQFGFSFVPYLSIIDTIMFLGIKKTRLLLTEMDLC